MVQQKYSKFLFHLKSFKFLPKIKLPVEYTLCCCGSDLIYGAWRVLVWSEDAVVEKGFCGGEEVFLDKGSNPCRGGFYSSVVVGFSPGGGGSCSSAVVVSVSGRGRLT